MDVPGPLQAFFSEANADGISMHSHLAEVIHKLLLEKPANPLESFESSSLEVKGKHFTAKEAGLKVRVHVPPMPPPSCYWSLACGLLLAAVKTPLSYKYVDVHRNPTAGWRRCRT